jgi:hypothetical protein
MQYAALATVKHRLRVGVPLPFNVRSADQTLLLARGQQVQTDSQLQALCDRGALVDLSELISPRDEVMRAPRAVLPRLWGRCMDQVAQALQNAPGPGFRQALDEVSAPVLALIERDPDLAIFQVLGRSANEDVAYGVRRSMQSAITAFLVAQRLAWDPEQIERVFKVALTMNISMLELQGQLARQRTPPTDEQRTLLATHPMRSVRILELSGVSDAAWLQAVLRHHEAEDGSGYPSGRSDICDLASLARRADLYTSKLAARSTRDALAADVAGREMFMQDPGHPMTAALVKEFGIYPPGCHVRLASGELAVVVARGPSITTPIVACLTDAHGRTLVRPQRRDTGVPAHAVAGIVGASEVPQRVSVEQLVAALDA